MNVESKKIKTESQVFGWSNWVDSTQTFSELIEKDRLATATKILDECKEEIMVHGN